MEEEAVIEQLENLAMGFGLEIRYEPTGFDDEINVAGGLCILRGEKLLIINSKAPVRDKIRAFARALSKFDLDQVYIKPAIRALIEIE